jgi:RNA polymerase sigma-70 factor, ECF subfamily
MTIATSLDRGPGARRGTWRGTIAIVAEPSEREPCDREPCDREPCDREIVGLESSREAFVAFYQSEYRSVVALAYALTGRAAVSEELAQDAFLVAHRNWARVSTYEVPGAFVRRVVSNMAVSFTRRLAAEARALARLSARSATWSTPLEPTDADFWRSVRSLPRRQSQALALRYLEDLSDEDIARILGCSVATVRVHLHNGRITLAGKLGLEANGRSSR